MPNATMPRRPSRRWSQRLLAPLFATVVPAQTPVGSLTLAPCTLELHAHWERLTDTKYRFEQRALVRDLAPAAARTTYDEASFRPLLPPPGAKVGEPWRLDPEAALPFLRQLHAGARTTLHHDGGSGVSAPGAWACLRVLDATHAEVALRVHAEFLIAGDGTEEKSSWFTPGSFRGRLAIDRATGRVVGFQLAVPPSRANVDLNLATGDGAVMADIGSVPRLELVGGTFPEPANGAAHITPQQADQLLERAFYPFAAIEWLDLPTARRVSRATGKPLHVVALFGSLTDESC
jgi:hypothetical protein